MKAKDYAKRFNEKMTEDEFSKEIYSVLMDFIEEGSELVTARGNTDSVILGVMREMDAKWQSFARKVEKVNIYGYRNFMTDEMPSLQKELCW